MAILRTG